MKVDNRSLFKLSRNKKCSRTKTTTNVQKQIQQRKFKTKQNVQEQKQQKMFKNKNNNKNLKTKKCSRTCQKLNMYKLHSHLVFLALIYKQEYKKLSKY